jgi:alpha-N-arabinofuranosidase
MTSRIVIDRERIIGGIQPTIFGGFIEHMGRAVYEGIYDPGSPCADETGIRLDVLEALKELSPSLIRYPGGNFLSGYHWQDGVGPRELRPRKRDYAWRSIETNQFGTDEFIDYCRRLGTQPMVGVNLGTGTIENAAALVEYCNGRGGSYYADLRRQHGIAEPYGVHYWCLGNEMDGPWQIGHLDAEAYGHKAREAAKLMKGGDPTIELTLCGSSNTTMPTYPDWDRIVVETCWEYVDTLSLHYYANNHDDDTSSYLALARQFEQHLDTLEGVLRFVQSKLRSKHQVLLSWDEWNVWYKDMTVDGQWTEAPHLIEEVYNLEDALVVAQWMNVFLRRSYILKIACLAQLVNVIAPILTRRDSLVRQTIFYPFMLFRRYAAGVSLDVLCQSPTYQTRQYGDVPLLDVSASYDEARGRSAVFIVNRSQTASELVRVVWQGWSPGKAVQMYQLAGDDPKLTNTFDQPDRIVPADRGQVTLVDGEATLTLPPLSFTVLAAG